MANHYYDATGVLILDKVTPVITALFGGFNLDPNFPGDGRAYIARIPKSDDPLWEDVEARLADLAADLGVPLERPDELERPDQPDLEPVLVALARHFNAEQNDELDNLIEHHGFEDCADLEALFLIATCFNDGHNLSAIAFEGCWSCDKPRLFEFGGAGSFISREISLHGDSTHVIELGGELRQALIENNLDEAANLIARETTRVLAGIEDTDTFETLRQRVAERLSHYSASEVAG